MRLGDTVTVGRRLRTEWWVLRSGGIGLKLFRICVWHLKKFACEQKRDWQMGKRRIMARNKFLNREHNQREREIQHFPGNPADSFWTLGLFLSVHVILRLCVFECFYCNNSDLVCVFINSLSRRLLRTCCVPYTFLNPEQRL